MAYERELVPPPAPRSRVVVAFWLLVATLVVVLAGWYATHPPALPTTDEPLQASAPVGQPVYVGIWSPSVESERTVLARGIDVDVDTPLGVSTVALVCKGGSIGVTTDPLTFCTDLLRIEGASISPGDVLVLQLVADQAGEVEIPRVRLTFREGLQWGTQEVGAPVVATFVGTE